MSEDLMKAFRDGLRPEPRMTVSEWADAHRVLSSEGSAEPGPWRTDRTPYLREIMDNLSATSPVQEVVVMKGAQIGFTEAGCNWIGYNMDVAPGPMLAVMPTDDTMTRNSRVRIDPMIRSTPRLASKVSAQKSRSGANNTQFKSFPGGQLIMTGANSAANMRSLPIRYLFLDEIDGYPMDVEGEGSPIKLAEKRTETFARRKIFKISTPTLKDQSAIEAEFETTDQRYYFLPCPHCGHAQRLEFKNLQWEKGKPETAMYFCEECGAGIEERFKPRMLLAGEWRPTKPENTSRTRRGYHLNSLYSPLGWYSWAKAARDFEKAQADANEMKTFTNTVLGEPYQAPGESPPWENIFNRREPREMNRPYADVSFITAGADVQKDRIEVEIVGWMVGMRSQSIDYRILYGETEKPEVWKELGKIMSEVWVKDDGKPIGVRLLGLDTGYNTSHCYRFAAEFGPTRVLPLKGNDSLDVPVSNPSPVHRARNGKRVGTIHVWHVGTGFLKSEIYGFLSLERNEDGTAPDGYCHFPQYGPNYFKGLTCEKLERKLTPKGFMKFVWTKPSHARNEPLDCRVYARAAAAIGGMDRMRPRNWKDEKEKSAESASGDKAVPAKKKKTRPDSIW